MKRETFKSTLEIASNVAVVLVAVAALSTLAITFFVQPATRRLSPGLEKGQRFGKVSSVDYSTSAQTLLIALNTNCSYCRESLPLYQRLPYTRAGFKSLRVVALFPNKPDEVAKYLKENQLLFESVA